MPVKEGAAKGVRSRGKECKAERGRNVKRATREGRHSTQEGREQNLCPFQVACCMMRWGLHGEASTGGLHPCIFHTLSIALAHIPAPLHAYLRCKRRLASSFSRVIVFVYIAPLTPRMIHLSPSKSPVQRRGPPSQPSSCPVPSQSTTLCIIRPCAQAQAMPWGAWERAAALLFRAMRGSVSAKMGQPINEGWVGKTSICCYLCSESISWGGARTCWPGLMSL